jgi:hypothetical protein
MRKFIESTTDHPARLQTALDLIELEETGLDGVVKDAMAALPGGDRRNLDSHYNMQPALEYLRKTDPAWASEWVATQVAEGVLDGHEYWLPFATAIPDDLVEKYLRRLETEDLKNAHFEGMIAVVAARADAKLAARVFSELRELRRKVDAEPGQRHEFEWQVMRQLEAMFRRLPDDAAAGGILSSVTSGDPRDIKVAANLLGRAARSDVEPLRIADENLKARLRAYLTSSVDLILRQDDFNGEKKANLASSIAQVGKPEDMAHLVTLIRADIERIRRGRAARAAGDGGPLGNGAIISYANWHVRAVVGLDPATADTVLLEVLKDPEYEREAAGALVELARTQVVDINKPFGSKKDFASIWDARAGKLAGIFDEARRERYAMAIRDQIAAIMDNSVTEGPTAPRDRRAKDLAVPLATIDGRDSVDLVLEVASLPGDWDAWTRVDALEKLLFSGASLPAEETLQVVDSVFTQIRSHHHDHQERYLVQRILCILPFVEPPSKGFDAMRQLIAGCAIQGYELCEVVAAVGCSSCDRALEFLREILASGQRTEQVWEACINATAAIDDRESRELLLSFVDRDDPGLSVREGDVLAHEIAELAQRDITTRRRILELCSQQPPPARRELLARIISRLDSEEAVLAGLSLIHDQAAPPVPRPIWRQLENVFVERRPYRGSPNTFTLAPRSANEIRTRLFEMASSDERRKRAAFGLLGQIELWRLEHGRPASEPRHPALASRLAWPIMHTEV